MAVALSVLGFSSASSGSSTRVGLFVVASFVVALGMVCSPESRAADAIKVLHSFHGADGESPLGALTMDPSGALYGTTFEGGTDKSFDGTIFRITPPKAGHTVWGESVLYSFASATDGTQINGGVAIDPSGALYGSTLLGGSGGGGEAYQLKPPAPGQTAWKFSILHSFTNGADGGEPVGTPIVDTSGVVYGVTEGGGIQKGIYKFGVVYTLTPPVQGETEWTLRVLHSFTGGKDGGQPFAGLISDSTGALYGTTTLGGTYNWGTAFKLIPPGAGQTVWRCQTPHDFRGGRDGESPTSPLTLDSSGTVYGTTNGGGKDGRGVVYKISPPVAEHTAWTESVLHSFTGGRDGGEPVGDVIVDSSGALYGTTRLGGPRTGGLAYKLTPPGFGHTVWVESALYSFADGKGPVSPNGALLNGEAGDFYGVTIEGGAEDEGTVYQLNQ